MTAPLQFPSSASLSRSCHPSIFARADYWRRSQPALNSRAGHKEWSHFCIFGAELELIVNFSLMEHDIADDARVCETPRIAIIVRLNDGTWAGDIDQFSPESTMIGEQRTD